MAFSDTPIIDQSSKHSERSERRMRDFLNQENGFICRTEVPDKGCDFYVELILDSIKSSSWNFAIQLKSIENPELVDNDQFISLSIETSRLGYLMRRIPAMGLIIFYSVEHDISYYEYVDQVYERLTEDRQSDNWKAQETVKVRIPVRNKLCNDSVKDIHNTFQVRFERAMQMQNSHGKKYGLPTFDLENGFEYDFRNAEHVSRFLSQYGILMLNNYDLEILYRMIVKIPNQEIYGDKNLLLIAAISYSEAGLIADSEIFCSKLSKIELQPSELSAYRFVRIKNQHALGYIDSNLFLRELKALEETAGESNKITLKINQVYYQLTSTKAFQLVQEEILETIQDVFALVEKSDEKKRTKQLLSLWNCENLGYWIASISGAAMGEIRIKESLNGPMPIEKRMKAADEIMKLTQLFEQTVSEINSQALNSQDKIVQAYATSIWVKFFIHQQINFYSFEVPVNTIDGFEIRIRKRINNAAEAYNLFLELHINKEAYDSICNMIELIELAERAYGIQTGYGSEDLYKTKLRLEKDFEFPPRKIVFVDLIDEKRRQASEPHDDGFRMFQGLDDSQVNVLARMALESFSLPEERLVNIVNEIKAYRIFYDRCNDPNIEIHQFRCPVNEKEKYSLPVRFILRSKATGIESAPSADMEGLLESWGY